MYYFSADNLDFIAYNQKIIQVITSYMSSMRFIMESKSNQKIKKKHKNIKFKIEFYQY
jgi:hypothetical protein